MSRRLIEIAVLGEFRVREGVREVEIRSPRQRAILAALAAHMGQSLEVEQLLDLIWGENAPSPSSVRFHVSKLRKALEPGRNAGSTGGSVLTTPSGYALNSELCSIDADLFEARITKGVLLVDTDPESARQTIDRGLSLWSGGEPYAEFRYAEFARPEIARLKELRLRALEAKYQASLAIGLGGSVVPDLEALCLEYPFRERFIALLMQALYTTGRQADALRLYETTRRRFVEELGIDLGPELAQMELRILEHDPGLIGSRRSRTLGNTTLPLTTLVGRSGELAALEALLTQKRLVTLVGVGGVGKTRLAKETAHSIVDRFPQGCWFVDLSSVDEEARLLPAVKLSLNDLIAGDVSGSSDELLEGLARCSALIILDNCEQIAAHVARFCEQLLVSAPMLHVLATSRAPLGLPGETVFFVEPLAVPADAAELSEIERSPAVSLLMDRTSDRGGNLPSDEPTLRQAAALCRGLDGLPLALELVARYIGHSPIEDLLVRIQAGLDIRSPGALEDRHRSLSLALDWSYELLGPSEAILFKQLGVFRGHFDLRAAQAVCQSQPEQDFLEMIVGLAEASLIVVDRSARSHSYRLLETVRTYALERIDEVSLADLRRRHASYYADRAADARAAWATPRRDELMAEVRAQAPNYQAAADWLLDGGRVAESARLVSGIANYWFYSGLHDEAIRTMTRVVEDSGRQPLEEVRQVIESLVPLLAWGGRLTEAKSLVAQHSSILERHPSPVLGKPERGLAGTIAWCEGDLPGLFSAVLDRRDALAEVGDPLAATVAASVAFSLTWMGRLEEASDARLIARSFADEFRTVDGRALMAELDGWLAFQSGELADSRQLWEEAQAEYSRLDLGLNVSEMTQMLGWVHLEEGRYEHAFNLLRSSQSELAPLSMKPFEIRGFALLALTAEQLGERDQARAFSRSGVSLAVRAGNRLGQVLLAYASAIFAVADGDLTRAGLLLDAALQLQEVCALALPRSTREAFAKALTSIAETERARPSDRERAEPDEIGGLLLAMG